MYHSYRRFGPGTPLLTNTIFFTANKAGAKEKAPAKKAVKSILFCRQVVHSGLHKPNLVSYIITNSGILSTRFRELNKNFAGCLLIAACTRQIDYRFSSSPAVPELCSEITRLISSKSEAGMSPTIVFFTADIAFPNSTAFFTSLYFSRPNSAPAT